MPFQEIHILPLRKITRPDVVQFHVPLLNRYEKMSVHTKQLLRFGNNIKKNDFNIEYMETSLKKRDQKIKNFSMKKYLINRDRYF